MNVQLVIESSGSLPYVLLHRDNKILHACRGNLGVHHSQILLRGIDECLHKSNCSLKDINSIAVGIGPGMFTGLRIGVATAKFLADANDIPTVPFSSLLAIGLSSPKREGRIWALNDARSKRVYALPLKGEDLDPLKISDPLEENAIAPNLLAEQMQAGDLLLGEGAWVYKNDWPTFVHIGTTDAKDFFSFEALATIGHSLFLAKRTAPALNLEPRYLKTGQIHLP